VPVSTSCSTIPTGSTSTPAAAPLRRRSREGGCPARGADVGFALDGDADRLIAVDASGCIVDGDAVLGVLALDRLARGRLPNGALVVSVLSNGGLKKTVEDAGGQIIRTPVGTSTSSTACSSTEPVWAARRAATSSSSSTRRAATEWSPPSRFLAVMSGQVAGLADLAAQVPMLLSSSGPSRAPQRSMGR